MKWNTYKLTLITMLAAIAVVGRIVFAPIPNAQPVTAIIILTGFWMGPLAAVVMAFLTTFLTNMVLGMGIWSVWQIVAWGIIGIGAGLIGKMLPKLPVWALSTYGFLSGLLFGLVMALTMRAIGQTFWGYYLAGLPFDLMHAASNFVFILVFYAVFEKLFLKYEQRVQLVC
ncbi:ECF transporter S component [Salimicrobium flavidum]|uniref:Energy-coupling factor transport system substrate-specific component n=1 Tax=Salimicrobium flavidum TaxID=570947 RepID=A0A1N7IIZ5_9BACI|nr:ECF transporter S component [Salimicrobium flavidum]SIS37065.1 energy-coupling factor transport system substrate-specific component [Salimicrobium flavidum]